MPVKWFCRSHNLVNIAFVSTFERSTRFQLTNQQHGSVPVPDTIEVWLMLAWKDNVGAISIFGRTEEMKACSTQNLSGKRFGGTGW